MSSVASEEQEPREVQFVHEDPAKYPEDEETENESENDSDGSMNSESEEEEDEDKAVAEVSVQDLLQEILTAIREDKRDLKNKAQFEDFELHEGRSLARKTKDPKQPTALHILAATDKKDLPEKDKLEPLVSFLVRQPENLLADRDRAGHTPLYLAISEKNERMVKWMCLAHEDIDSILCIPSYEEKNCLHLAIELRAKFAGFLVEQVGATTLCAKDKDGNTPLHLAVEYKRCRKEQLLIVEAIVEKCDDEMRKSKDGVFNNASLSPYRHHLESCEKAERDKKKKEEAKRKAKDEKGGDKSDARARPDGTQRISREPKAARPAPSQAPGFNPPANTDGKLRRLDTQADSRREPPPGKEFAPSKYGAQQKFGLARTPVVTTAPDFASERGGDDKKLLGRISKKSEAQDSSKDTTPKVTDETILPIRNFLKEHYLRERGHDVALEILYGRNTTSDLEIYFDLSGYIAMTQTRLKKTLDFLSFEEILQYVEIPKLTIESNTAIANTKKSRGKAVKQDGSGRSDLIYLFNGLRGKKVKTILKVIVDDLTYPAHSDSAIEEALDKMGVEIWDWRKLDISSEVIQKVASSVREVSLYWSGNNAVLRGWSDERGLNQLKQLQRVHLHVEQGLESRTRTTQNVADFYRRMQDLCPNVVITDEGSETMHDLVDTNTARNESEHVDLPPKHEWVQCMKDFKQLLFDAETYLEREGIRIDRNIEEPILVALIDDGINVNKLEQYSPIGGRSFCTRDADQNLNFPYYGSSSGHGTIMASQIYRICPRTHLYVLKLDDHATASTTRQITAKSAAQAIRAAVRKKVHIISMSWTIDPPEDEEERRDLESAILEAANEDILMFCSARDKGAKQAASYPSKGTNKIFTIGAAEASGAPDVWVGNLTHIDFTFPGNQVESEDQGDGQALEIASGSSVATALAAGLAALILYCVQIRVLRAPARDKEKARKDFQSLKKHDQMMKALKSIGTTEESNNKYIAVWDVFGKMVTESEKCDRNTWIDLIAEVGTTLCMRL